MSRRYYYLGDNRGLTQLASGQLFIVDTRARDIATWIIHSGVWETFVDRVVCRLARPGDTFVDVGSNMGYYAVKVGDLVGEGGRVFAYEPNPNLFEVLSDNMHVNGFGGRARLFEAAAGEAAGEAVLAFEPRFPGGGRTGPAPAGPQGAFQERPVKVVTLDDTVAGEAHLIKIDVEGFEPLVLKGMTGLLERSPDAAVVIEVSADQWSRFGDPAETLVRFAAGRRLFHIRADGRIEDLRGERVGACLAARPATYILMLPDTEARYAQVRSLAAAPGSPVRGTGRPPRWKVVASRWKNRILG